MNDYAPNDLNHEDSPIQNEFNKIVSVVKEKLGDKPLPKIKELLLSRIRQIKSNHATDSTAVFAAPKNESLNTIDEDGTASHNNNSVISITPPAALNSTNNSTVPDNLFKMMDANPLSDEFDVSYTSGNCFSISSDYTVPFNNQKLQPFVIQGNTIASNTDLNKLFNGLAKSECDKLVFFELTAKLLSNSKQCTGKPMCYSDCTELNLKFKQCGFPAQTCSNVEQCTSLKYRSQDRSAEKALAWWAILLIILALAIPLFIAIYKVLKNKRKKASGSQRSTSTINTVNSDLRKITRVRYNEEIPPGPNTKRESGFMHSNSNSDLGGMI